MINEKKVMNKGIKINQEFIAFNELQRPTTMAKKL